jgi:hypothetical protein
MVVRALLVATLAVTAAVVANVVRRGEPSAGETAVYLLVLTALFVLRVVGQVVVLLWRPGWLPPMEQWNLVPYRLLLPIQLLFLAAMGAIIAGLLVDDADRNPGFGRLAIGISLVYAASMAVRYGVRMYRRPAQRWFGGAIPIVFHLVLAAFLFAWGRYHVA